MTQCLPIAAIADGLGLSPHEWEPYGWHKAKLAFGLAERLAARPQRGRYVVVTATSPTPMGEGKTVTAIGLAMALHRRVGPAGSAIATLRQPSLAPIFGVKGGGAGGGRAALVPSADVNLHLTGDLHAVAAAHNLLAAIVDNHLGRAASPAIDPESIDIRRVIDVGDRALRAIRSGIGGGKLARERETGFDLTAASEVMAILTLASSAADVRARLGKIVVGVSRDGNPISAEDLGCAGAMAAVLRDAVRPNVVQTSEHTPAFVHAGPFANIAPGASSLSADLAALRLADYVVTEAGFGADCGAEKLFDIKCRSGALRPDAVVVVSTARSLRLHGGGKRAQPGDLGALRAGAPNLKAHIEIVERFGPVPIVAINRFPGDSEAEIGELRSIALEAGAASAVVADAYARGSDGCLELADAVIAAAARAPELRLLYPLELSLADKTETIARAIYGADGIDLAPAAADKLARFEELGFREVPICVAKTQFSLSHDPSWLGRPQGYRFPIADARLAAGAGYVYVLAGEVTTMPGLPARPAALGIDLDPTGEVTGIG